MRIGHVMGIVISGMTWLAIGVLLTFKGLMLTVYSVCFFNEGSYPLVSVFNRLFGHLERSGICLIFLAMIIGMLKGRFVLAKTVNRFVKRILLIPSPLKLYNLFSWRYLVLIGCMMCLGIGLKFLPISKDIRGFIDLAIGSALINGAFLYFKQASMLRLEFLRKKK
jgi:hypothetical protein